MKVCVVLVVGGGCSGGQAGFVAVWDAVGVGGGGGASLTAASASPPLNTTAPAIRVIPCPKPPVSLSLTPPTLPPPSTSAPAALLVEAWQPSGSGLVLDPVVVLKPEGEGGGGGSNDLPDYGDINYESAGYMDVPQTHAYITK